MNIIVTGSLGNISKPLAQQLLQKGHSVTIISSNPDKQKDIEALEAKAAIGKLADVNFLIDTFTGADAVYCMIPFDFKEEDQKKYFQNLADSYVQAIKTTNIKKAVFLSGWAADIVKSHNAGQMLTELSAIAVAELRPGSFYTNFYGYIGMIKEKGVIMANYGGEDKIAFVSPNDIATAAFEELVTAFQGKKIRYVASDELTCDEAAGILGEAIGKPGLKWITITEEQMLNGLLHSGVPSQLAKDLVDMQVAMHSGAAYENYLRNRPVLGKTRLKDFAKDFEGLLSYCERFYRRQFITREKANDQILSRVDKMITERFKNGNLNHQGLPTVQSICEDLNISVSYLSRVLKLLTGQSTQQFIHEKLIAKAKEKLSTTDQSVSEIAYELGFEHPQSFSKLFKTKTTVSPLAFRQSFN